MWVVTGSLLFLRTRKQQTDPTASSHVGRIFVPRYPSKGKAAARRKEQRKRTRPLRYFPKRANRVFRRAYGCCRSLGLAASRRQSKSGVTRVCVACVSTQHPYCPRQSPVLRDMLSPMLILRAPAHTASLHVGRLFCSRESQRKPRALASHTSQRERPCPSRYPSNVRRRCSMAPSVTNVHSSDKPTGRMRSRIPDLDPSRFSTLSSADR